MFFTVPGILEPVQWFPTTQPCAQWVVKWWKYLRKEDGACPSLQEKTVIGSCLYEISCFFPSLAFLQHQHVARTFVCTFWYENQLYLDSTTFSTLTFVPRQQNPFCTAADSYQVWFLFALDTCLFRVVGWHGWTGFGSVVGSLQELWQRPVLPQLAPAEIEYENTDHLKTHSG